MDEATIRKRAENLWRALDQDVNFFRDFGVDIITNELRAAYADGMERAAKAAMEYLEDDATYVVQSRDVNGCVAAIRQAAGEVTGG